MIDTRPSWGPWLPAARYHLCAGCGDGISPGDTIRPDSGDGYLCADCGHIRSAEEEARERWGAVPEGHVLVAAPDPDWRLDGGGRCRAGASRGRPACGKPSAAAFRRFSYRANGNWYWWRYCEQHMYGRWIEDGKVMALTLRRAGEAA